MLLDIRGRDVTIAMLDILCDVAPKEVGFVVIVVGFVVVVVGFVAKEYETLQAIIFISREGI